MYFLKNLCQKSFKFKDLRACCKIKSIRFYSQQYKVLFFGTDSFSLPSLKLLFHENEFKRLEVVTSFKSRKNPVYQYANTKGLILHSWEEVKENHELIKEFDVGLVVSFGHLIKEKMINNFKYGMLNVHASLLPAYRGASPIIYAIKNHEKKTGVSIMKIKPHAFDVGDILATQEIEISDHILMNELHNQLAKLGAKLLIDCLRNLESIKPIEQDEISASYAPKIDGEFTKIRWNEMTALEIYDLYRALYSYKHVSTTFNCEPVKFIEVKLAYDDQLRSDVDVVGRIKFCRKSKKLFARAVDGNYVEIVKLLVGKKVMTAIDFNNGFIKNVSELERKFE